MRLTRAKARVCGGASIAGVLGLQGFNSFACYDNDLSGFIEVVALLLAVPMLPALISLLTSNPLCAVGSSLGFAPWLLVAYHVDCVAPYAGGGASMIYVAVFLWGTLTSTLGALLTIPIAAVLHIHLVENEEEAALLKDL